MCCDLVASGICLDHLTHFFAEQARQLSSRLLSCMAEQQGRYVPTITDVMQLWRLLRPCCSASEYEPAIMHRSVDQQLCWVSGSIYPTHLHLLDSLEGH